MGLWSFRPGSASPDRSSEAAAISPSAGVPVVIYLIDTLRADRLSVYGYPTAQTPNFDALAKESVLFEKAYSAGPWTLPSLASLITSTYPCEHDLNDTNHRLKGTYTTLAQRLQAAGYRTGSFYTNLIAGPMADLDRGYEVSVLREAADADVLIGLPEFLDQSGTKPFLLSIHTMEPHQPFYAPYEFTKRLGHISVEEKERFFNDNFLFRSLRFVDFTANQPLGTTDNTAEQAAVRARFQASTTFTNLYDASVSFADANLGKVVAELKRRGLWEKSLFIVLSDHGEELGDHGDWTHDQSLYEELMHVPLLIHFPGGGRAGSRVADHVSLVDIMPTILAYAAVPGGCQGCRGESLLPVIAGTSLARPWVESGSGVRMNRAAYYRPARELRGDRNVAVRRDTWKAIWNADVETVELYDLARDPGEQLDQSAAKPELARELRDEAISWFEQCMQRVSGEAEVVELDELTRQRLRSIGYLK